MSEQLDYFPANTPLPDPLSSLRSFTAARIALGRSGTSIPLRESLSFALAHAYARDAVYSVLATTESITTLNQQQLCPQVVYSQAKTRQEYLQRPDLGRRLTAVSSSLLTERASKQCDIAIILADGLSATAINDHALPLLTYLLPQLKQAGFSLAPIIVAEQARVAISDEIGYILHARLTLLLIGERPGLSSPSSLGAYLTYAPRLHLTDEARNCVSNIRPEGLSLQQAADKLLWLTQQAFQRQLSGVNLKDEDNLLV